MDGSGSTNRFTAPFKSGGKWDIPLIAGFALINSLGLLNASLHDPTIGYDAASHLEYIGAFSNLHLVKDGESDEFFSPPLPYLLPAVLVAATDMPVIKAAKIAQLANVVVSIGLIWYLIRICRLLSAGNIVARGTILFIGTLPVYYKTFAFIRGEPWVALFAVMAAYYLVRVLIRREYAWPNILLAGFTTGCAMLSRQWGVLLLPGIVVFGGIVWFRDKNYRRSIFKALSISIAIALMLSSWFYFHLRHEYGAFTAFNRTPGSKVFFANQPRDFYFGISPELLFSRPVRPNFPNELIPIFYSEIWGDYWCFFDVFGKNLTRPGSRRLTGPWLSLYNVWEQVPDWMGTNYNSMGKYLGRVNAIAIFPSLLALTSLVAVATNAFSRKKEPSHAVVTDERSKVSLFFLLMIVCSVAGYLWFLIRYPSPEKGDTIKATYLLHLFPIVAVCVGLFLERIEQNSRLISQIIIGLLLLVALHNLPVMVTHYPLYPVPWAK